MESCFVEPIEVCKKTTIAPRPELGLGRILNQCCSSRRDLSNAMSHSSRRRREEVDS